MDYTKEELWEAKCQLDSLLHKLRGVVKTLEAKEAPNRYKAQITLAQRRIQALELSNGLINKALQIAEE